MEHIPVFTLITCAAAVVALSCGCVCLMLALKARRESQHHLAVAVEIDGQLATVRQELQTVSQRAAEQRDRLAQLEAREWRRAVQPEAEEVVSAAAAPARQNVTERRHRVLRLAQRGLDARTIAETLGLPQGEVALIVGLNKARAEAE